VLLALAARAAAEPLDDTLDVDPEQAELAAQPADLDAPSSADASADLDTVGIGAVAGTEDWLEAQARHQRPSPWGRLDLQLSWLHRDDAPATVAAHRYDEAWLVVIWRR